MAIAKGAVIFEKHFTLDHNLAGPDHWFSCDPVELKGWIDTIQTAYLKMGQPYLVPTKKEHDMRILARRSVVALRDIKKGEVYSEKNIGIRRPGNGLPPDMLDFVIGQQAMTDLKIGSPIGFKDVGNHGPE